ncbi:hypothetical protein [Nannocystis pusilla]|uniref:hypothetical protein n=1 Tax=Nannocystis pusilla TaxID=889268 RepID=UPI003BF12CA9
MFGEGTARRITGGSIDLCNWERDEVIVSELAEPQFFSDCLAEPEGSAHRLCFMDAVVTEVAVRDEGVYVCSAAQSILDMALRSSEESR